MDSEAPEKATRQPSARQRRAMSAIVRSGARRPATAARRPATARRPYSAYTKKDGEEENMTKCDPPQSNREWWRFYVKVTREHAKNVC